MTGSIAGIVRAIEALNDAVGRTVSWLAVVLVFTTCLVAVLRYGFSIGFVWMQELYVWMHAAVFLLVSGYTLQHEGHVRIDVFYGPASLRTKAWINIFGTLVFLFPMLALIAYVGTPYVLLSWTRLEASQEAGGLHGLFLLKSCMLGFVVLLALQGVALLLRSAMVIAGNPEWDPSNRKPADGH
ncbi:MAG: TRAP transporter small permease subunit [Hyphomicrobiaceae bacterium]|nr:TRAP transporter small permease subunit [Hyphomicrobiaceae bacterium]